MSLPSVAIAITSAPRALTSATLERTSSTGLSVATQTTGVNLVEQRDQPVLHLPGGVRIGRDVGDLLHLQRALEADGEADVAAEVEEEATLVVAAGDRADLGVGSLDGLVDLARQRLQLGDQLGDALAREGIPGLREPEPEQVDGGDLAREGLGGGDADLEAGSREQDRVGVLGRLAPHHVGDPEHVSAPLAREPHRGEGVGRLARLGDADDEIARADDRVAIAVLGGDVHLDGDPRPGLDRVPAREPGVVAGAAGDDDDAAHLSGLLGGQRQLAEVDRVDLGEAVGDRLGDRVGLPWISFIMKVG